MLHWVQVSEEAYASAVEVANVNREEGGVEARSVEAALEALAVTVGGDAAAAADRHPERCGGAVAYAAGCISAA